jgi:hypothetical protein
MGGGRLGCVGDAREASTILHSPFTTTVTLASASGETYLHSKNGSAEA